MSTPRFVARAVALCWALPCFVLATSADPASASPRQPARGQGIVLKRLWSVPASGVWSDVAAAVTGEGATEIYALAQGGQVTVLSAAGKPLRRFRVAPGDTLIQATGHWAGGSRLVTWTNWGQAVHGYDGNGKPLWTVDNETGVDWAHIVEGKGDTYVIIGYNGGGGLHVLDDKGHERWSTTRYGNCWNVGFARTGSTGGYFLTTEAGGGIHEFDQAGKERRAIKGANYLSSVFGADLNRTGADQIVALGSPLSQGVGGNEYVYVFDLEGTFRWRRSLGTGGGSWRGKRLAAVAGPQGKHYLAVTAEPNRLLLFGPDGSPALSQSFTPAPVSLCSTGGSSANGRLLVCTGQAVSAYSVAQGSQAPSERPPKQRPAEARAAATAESPAMRVLKRVQTTVIRLKTYQADCYTTLTFPPRRGRSQRREMSRLYAAKPNLMRYDEWYLRRDPRTGRWVRARDRSEITFVCNGTQNWKQFGDHLRTDEMVMPEAMHTILEPWDGFYAAESSPYGYMLYQRRQGEVRDLHLAGRQRVDGVLCDKVFAHIKTSYQGDSQEYWQTWYVGLDGLVRRRVERVAFGGKPGFTRDDVIRNIRLNTRIAPTRFTYTAPKGVLSEAEYERKHPTPALLAAGTAAPDFTATDDQNKPIRLSDLKGKVVVLDFWASWCGPCMASMPHNQEIAKKLQAEGLPLVLFAVDDGEEREVFDSWVKSNRARYSAISFAFVQQKEDVSGKLYHVTGIPTQYVVDKEGIVRASFVGYSGPSDDLEKAVRAALGSVTRGHGDAGTR